MHLSRKDGETPEFTPDNIRDALKAGTSVSTIGPWGVETIINALVDSKIDVSVSFAIFGELSGLVFAPVTPISNSEEICGSMRVSSMTNPKSK